jgi:cytidylate kinase
MIVTLDGPAGAGKSSAAKALAARLGFRFLDTGAMYRAVALAALRRRLDWDRPEQIAQLARQVQIELRDGRVLLDGEDVSQAIRTAQITSLTYHAANNARVREHLVELQRQAAGNDNVVTEGRDQGTVVFPDAQCKIFLTASPLERAKRRQRDLEARGEHIPLEQVLEQQNLRDERDTHRQVGPLVPAWDAVIVCTDGMTPEEVVEHLEHVVRQKSPDVRV